MFKRGGRDPEGALGVVATVGDHIEGAGRGIDEEITVAIGWLGLRGGGGSGLGHPFPIGHGWCAAGDYQADPKQGLQCTPECLSPARYQS